MTAQEPDPCPTSPVYSSGMLCIGCGARFSAEPLPTWPCPKCGAGPLLRLHLHAPAPEQPS